MEGLRGGHQRRAEHGVRAVSDQEFCRAVLDQIPRATAAEREDICRELMEHLEDHREALMEGGLDEAAAQARSVEAMGDAGEIGRQWNQRLSPLWLWVGRVCKAAAILLVLGMLLPLSYTARSVSQNLNARWSSEPMDGWRESDALWSEKVDLCVPFGDQVIRFFQVSLVEEAWTDSQGRTWDCQVELDVLAYAQNPLNPALDMKILRDTTCNGAIGVGGGYGSTGVSAWSIRYLVPPGTPEATFTLSCHGETASVTVPLDWEEAGYGA